MGPEKRVNVSGKVYVALYLTVIVIEFGVRALITVSKAPTQAGEYSVYSEKEDCIIYKSKFVTRLT